MFILGHCDEYKLFCFKSVLCDIFPVGTQTNIHSLQREPKSEQCKDVIKFYCDEPASLLLDEGIIHRSRNDRKTAASPKVHYSTGK